MCAYRHSDFQVYMCAYRHKTYTRIGQNCIRGMSSTPSPPLTLRFSAQFNTLPLRLIDRCLNLNSCHFPRCYHRHERRVHLHAQKYHRATVWPDCQVAVDPLMLSMLSGQIARLATSTVQRVRKHFLPLVLSVLQISIAGYFQYMDCTLVPATTWTSSKLMSMCMR